LCGNLPPADPGSPPARRPGGLCQLPVQASANSLSKPSRITGPPSAPPAAATSRGW
jgi:hypothetical protein